MLKQLERRRELLWEVVHTYNKLEDIPTPLNEAITNEINDLDIQIDAINNMKEATQASYHDRLMDGFYDEWKGSR